MENTPSPTSRYRIEKREHSGGGLYELESTTYYYIVDNSTEKIVMTFTGGYSASYDGQGWADGVSGGVTEVELTPDGEHVLVHEAGSEQPKKVRISES